jgi:hypothetical protein
MSRKRLIPVLALTVSAMFAAVPSAHATDDTMGAAGCVLLPGVAGTTTQGTDGVNAPLDGQNPDAQFGGGWDPLELLDTDPGGFTFQGNAVCTGADVASEAGNPGPQIAIPVVAQITATGDYDNLICGTGTAYGNATVNGTSTVGPLSVTITNLTTRFGITFAAGTGDLSYVVTGGSITATDPRGTSTNTIEGGNGVGVINIAPTNGNCVNEDVKQFNVIGAFAGSLSGEGTDDSDGDGTQGGKDSDG